MERMTGGLLNSRFFSILGKSHQSDFKLIYVLIRKRAVRS